MYPSSPEVHVAWPHTLSVTFAIKHPEKRSRYIVERGGHHIGLRREQYYLVLLWRDDINTCRAVEACVHPLTDYDAFIQHRAVTVYEPINHGTQLALQLVSTTISVYKKAM